MPYWLDDVMKLLRAETYDLRELARLVGRDPRTFYRGINPDDLELSGQDVSGMEFSDAEIKPDYQKLVLGTDNKYAQAIKVVQQIHHMGKQEERMAILIDLILRNPNDALLLTRLYAKDRAKYANAVLKYINVELATHAPRGTLFPEDEASRRLNAVELARIVNRPFSRGMPSNRALLLYYMAKHLAKYPDINSYLRSRLANSRSVFLAPYRREIVALLDSGNEDANS